MQIFQKLFQNRESRSIFIRQVSDSFRLFITPVPNYYVLQSYDESGDSINFGFFCEKMPGIEEFFSFFCTFVLILTRFIIPFEGNKLARL